MKLLVGRLTVNRFAAIGHGYGVIRDENLFFDGINFAILPFDIQLHQMRMEYQLFAHVGTSFCQHRRPLDSLFPAIVSYRNGSLRLITESEGHGISPIAEDL